MGSGTEQSCKHYTKYSLIVNRDRVFHDLFVQRSGEYVPTLPVELPVVELEFKFGLIKFA